MNEVQFHRGPDGGDIWEDRDTDVSIILGHRRLAIIDLSGDGRQPMQDSSGRFTIVFNGELYNYLELRAELKKLGATFRSRSDTEVILEAYKAWGEGCLARLNGMFAFALYDKARRILFCARDRYGEKPFLFVTKPGVFVFASEYKALLQVPGISHHYDEFRLLRGLHNTSMGLDTDRQTVFHDIQQLLPAEAMRIDVDTLRIHVHRYWDVSPREDYTRLREDEASTLFRDFLTDAVRIRMRSDVAVGSCLSGGLDSSTIVSLIRKVIHPDGEYHTFTGRFPGTSADEWSFAGEVVREMGVTSHVVEPTADRFVADLADFIWFNELPVGSSSQYAQYCVFRLAKEKGITVLLDGQGGDELLGGYEQYFQHYATALGEVGERKRLERELPGIRDRYPLALIPPVRAWRDRLPFQLRRWLSHRFSVGTNLLYGLKPDIARRVTVENERGRVDRFNALSSALYQDSFGMNLTTLLRYGDRNSMAHSREVRLPFCDHRLAELVFSLPPWYLMGQVQTKRLLRESTRGILPEPIRTRWTKQGFLPPQALWFRSKALLDMARDTFCSSSFINSDLWIASWWQTALNRLENGESSLSWTVWHPFISEMWRQHFVEQIKSTRSDYSHTSLPY